MPTVSCSFLLSSLIDSVLFRLFIYSFHEEDAPPASNMATPGSLECEAVYWSSKDVIVVCGEAAWRTVQRPAQQQTEARFGPCCCCCFPLDMAHNRWRALAEYKANFLDTFRRALSMLLDGGTSYSSILIHLFVIYLSIWLLLYLYVLIIFMLTCSQQTIKHIR